MARTEAEQQSAADAIYGACRAVCVLVLAVTCAILPRACVDAYDEPPPILTPVLSIWLALCPLAVIAGFAARRLDRDLRDAAAAVLLVPTALLAVVGMRDPLLLVIAGCAGAIWPRGVRVTRGLAAEFVAMMTLLTAVVGAWLLLALGALGGAVVAPAGVWEEHARHPGIELALFPLAAVAGFASRRRVAARPRWLPLAAAAVFVAAIAALNWSLQLPSAPLWVERWPAAALIAGVGYGGAIVYPRLTATLAGAIGVPALAVVFPVIVASSRTQYWSFDSVSDEWWWIKAGGACALLALSLAAAWFPGWPRLLGYAGCGGAVVLFFVAAPHS